MDLLYGIIILILLGDGVLIGLLGGIYLLLTKLTFILEDVSNLAHRSVNAYAVDRMASGHEAAAFLAMNGDRERGKKFASLQKQLRHHREILLSLREKRSKYVSQTDVPIDIDLDIRHQEAAIAAILEQLENL